MYTISQILWYGGIAMIILGVVGCAWELVR